MGSGVVNHVRFHVVKTRKRFENRNTPHAHPRYVGFGASRGRGGGLAHIKVFVFSHVIYYHCHFLGFCCRDTDECLRYRGPMLVVLLNLFIFLCALF
jgi:hypothetical protein